MQVRLSSDSARAGSSSTQSSESEITLPWCVLPGVGMGGCLLAEVETDKGRHTTQMERRGNYTDNIKAGHMGRLAGSAG